MAPRTGADRCSDACRQAWSRKIRKTVSAEIRCAAG